MAQPFALTLKQNNTERLYCLNVAAEDQGLHRGMPFTDARAFCPDLLSQAADPAGDAGFLHMLRRWATRYCPWVGLDGSDGVVLDVTGATHLAGGEEPMLLDMQTRLARAGISARIGMADTRGAAWALAHFANNTASPYAAPGPRATRDALAPLPVAALRLEPATVVGLERLGLRHIKDLADAARAPLARRFGKALLMRLDQAMGDQPEQVTPLSEPPHYGVRMTLPEPIGLAADVMAGTSRLLDQLCAKLKAQEMGARILTLTLRRVDQASQQVELRLAAPMRDPARILPLFERGVAEVDAGFGIDQLRLVATRVAALAVQQISAPTYVRGAPSGLHAGRENGQLEDLITRLGTRIGLENIQRFLPADSHIPERGFLTAPAAFSQAETGWQFPRPRPLRLFTPEPIAGYGPTPPDRFRWRRMAMTTARATGPERIAPEWWLEDEAWRSGLRDYWRVETQQGRRLWLYFTPQNPGWFVQGEFA